MRKLMRKTKSEIKCKRKSKINERKMNEMRKVIYENY